MQEIYVVIGGRCCGKTSTLRELKELDPEKARWIIEQIKAGVN